MASEQPSTRPLPLRRPFARPRPVPGNSPRTGFFLGTFDSGPPWRENDGRSPQRPLDRALFGRWEPGRMDSRPPQRTRSGGCLGAGGPMVLWGGRVKIPKATRKFTFPTFFYPDWLWYTWPENESGVLSGGPKDRQGGGKGRCACAPCHRQGAFFARMGLGGGEQPCRGQG